ARRSPGHRAVPAVELDDPLDLVDPDGPEALGAVRSLQTHAATVPPQPGGPATVVRQVIEDFSDVPVGRAQPKRDGPVRPVSGLPDGGVRQGPVDPAHHGPKLPAGHLDRVIRTLLPEPLEVRP